MADHYLIGQGGRHVSLDLPVTWEVIKSADLEARGTDTSIPELVTEALVVPVGTDPLAELLVGKKTVAIAVDDLTRPTPRRAILACVVDFLNAHGIGDDQIDVLIGVGTHAPVTDEEIIGCFGDDLCARVRFTNHDCRADDLVSVGTLPFSGEVLLNRVFMEADFRMAIGSIVPHPWNGFGGGAKSVLPGMAGWDTIKRHHLALTAAKGVTFGNLVDNPFHEEVYEGGRMAGLDFIVNAVYDADEKVKAIVAGHFEEAFRYGAGICIKELGVSFDRAADVTIVSAFPYESGPQIMKPLGSATTVTKKGGTVVLFADHILGGRFPAFMLEAFGKALGLSHGDPRGLVLNYMSRGELIAPEAPMDVNSAINTTLLYLSRVRVVLVSKDADAQQAARLGFDHAGSLEEAVARVSSDSPSAAVNIIPAGGLVLPLPAEDMRFEY